LAPAKQQISAMQERPSEEAAITRKPRWLAAPDLGSIAYPALVIAAAIGVAHVLRDFVLPQGAMLVFLVTVLVNAVTFGFWGGMLSAALAFVGYNFFFVEPLFTLQVEKSSDLAALAAFLVAAALTGFLAGRLREEAKAAQDRADMLELLSGLGSDLADARDVEEIRRILVSYLSRACAGPSVLLRREGEHLSVAASQPAGLQPEPAELEAAERTLRRGSLQPAAASGWPGSRMTFVPVNANGSTDGIAGWVSQQAGGRQSRFGDMAAAGIVRQVSMALERAELQERAAREREKADREALRSALLASMSHDLRTPLATILGSVTSIRQLGQSMPANARADLLAAIEEEAGRLARHVDNLLDMTRLQSGGEIRSDWIDGADTAQLAVMRARRIFPQREILFEARGSAALVRGDASLVEQVVFNLIDNAIKFSPAGKPVEVAAALQGSEIEIAVRDHGPGLGELDRQKMFEPFHRGAGVATTGSGLGLAICRGIIAAHGGRIEAESPVSGSSGTAIRVFLPVPEEKPA
jgi:two-component system, OmpR family, sensor histidine kinase KdpD